MATTMVKPGRKGYKILFDTNTVIMNHKFAAAAAVYGSDENRLIRDIRADFPGMTEVVISGRVQTSAKANHRLTYGTWKSTSGSTRTLTSFWLCLKQSRLHLSLWQVPTSMLRTGLRHSSPTTKRLLSLARVS